MGRSLSTVLEPVALEKPILLYGVLLAVETQAE
jgi:hypothetical protein